MVLRSLRGGMSPAEPSNPDINARLSSQRATYSLESENNLHKVNQADKFIYKGGQNSRWSSLGTTSTFTEFSFWFISSRRPARRFEVSTVCATAVIVCCSEALSFVEIVDGRCIGLKMEDRKDNRNINDGSSVPI